MPIQFKPPEDLAPKPKGKTEPLSARFEPEDAAYLKQRSLESGASISDIIVHAMKKYIEWDKAEVSKKKPSG